MSKQLRKRKKATRLLESKLIETEKPSLSNQTDIARGTINHSALGALVTSKVFSMRVEKAKKGKGSYKRKAKHSGKESYQIAA